MGQIKNIKLHIVTDIKHKNRQQPVKVNQTQPQKWLALSCVVDFPTTPSPTPGEYPRHRAASLCTSTPRKLEPRPNVVTAKKNFDVSNLCDQNSWRISRGQRRRYLVLMVVHGALLV